MRLRLSLGVRPFTLRGLLSVSLLALLSVSTASPGYPLAAASDETSVPRRGRKIQVGDARLARGIAAQGGRLLAEYGSYHLLEVDSAAAVELARHPQVEIRDDYDLILLNAATLDTRTREVHALSDPVEGFAGKRTRLVQFVGPVRPEWYSALTGTGVQVVTYIPHNAYLVYGDAPSLAAVELLPSEFVQWQGPYRDEYRIDPTAREGGKGDPLAAPKSGLYAVQLVSDDSANPDTLQVIDKHKLSAVKSEFRILEYLNLIVELPPDGVLALAAQPDVVSIQPYVVPRLMDERQDQILAGNLTGNVPSGPGYLNFLASRGFTQAQFRLSGFVVDVSDTGIDNATTSPNHFGLYENGIRPGTSRVAYNRLVGTPNPGSTLQGCDGHGNLDAHIVAGYDNLAGFPHADASGFRYGLGVCPFVRVGSTVIFDPGFTFPNYTTVQSSAYDSAARVSTNSWGSDAAGLYTFDAQVYDALVRDAQPTGAVFSAPGNQEMVILFSSGNRGPGATTVGTPGTAKNVITIGAAENVRAFGGADNCTVGDAGADSANDIIAFSSRGPTADARRKPDLVGPGTHVTGGVAQVAAPGANGTANACYNGSGVCGGLAPSIFFPAGQQFFTASSGTSHSTPAVAGGAALLRQHFINQGLAPPSPALTKAYLMNAARYMTGAGANDTLWSNNQGMGMMNLGTAFDATTRGLRDQVAADMFTASGQTRTFTGVVPDPGKPFRVTLAWTDAPGNTGGNAFNNDLDLTVTIAGNTYRGNVFTGATSTTGGAADPRNNVESVFLPAGTAGAFVIVVRATNINSDGVPNVGGALDQDFALVVYNGSATPQPVMTAAGSAITAESCDGNGAIDPGETVTVSLGLRNVGEPDTTNLVATLLATGGVGSPSGPQTYGVLVAGGATLSRPFTFTASGACGGTLTATLQLQDGAVNLGTVAFMFPLGGSTPPVTTTFSNTGNIFIPGSGAADPYPSNITVSGLTGTVTRVTVDLNTLAHTFPDDIDVLLVGPAGQNAMLMSDVGGNVNVSNVTLTVDDAAAAALPDSGPLVSGTFRPFNGAPGETLPLPAPAPPFGTALSAFNGTNPNGTWRLYVFDDSTSDLGALGGGWRVNITTALPLCCTGCPTITVNPGTIPSGTTGVAYAQTFTQTGGTGPITWSLTGTLPAGLTLDTGTGVLSGTATQTGSFPITVKATQPGGCNGSRNYTLVINCATLTVNPATLPSGTAGSAYSQTFTQTGGVGPVTWSLTGTLPAGMSFNTGMGVLSGTPTQTGITPLTIRATDGAGCTGVRNVTLLILCPGIGIGPGTIPNGTAGAAYSQTFTQMGGIGTITWSVSGTLPAGVTLNPATGVLSGTPTKTGSFPITITATDANDCFSTRGYTLVINCQAIAVNPGTIPNGTAGTAYSQAFTQTGAIGTVTWSVSGTLPAGVTLNPVTGVLSGTPTQTGSFPITITASDGNDCVGSRGYTLVIDCQTISVDPASIPNGTAGSPYAQTFTQTGGMGTITWSVSGTLPAGVTLNAMTGVLSGTPTQTGSFPITITASDGNGCLGSRGYTLVIDCQTISVGPASIPNGTAGSPYSQTFTQTSGIGTITWSVSGTLPAGLSLDPATGVLSGTPTQTGTFNFSVKATDANGCTAARSYTLVVGCQTIRVDPASIPAATASSAYSQTFTQTSGIGTITWSLTGTLPTGLSLEMSTGVLSGTPTQLGSFKITVRATDANGCGGSRDYTLTVNAAGPFVPTALVVDQAGSKVLEAGETAIVAPSWRNDTGAPQPLTGVASQFTGPGTSTYTISDSTADYGALVAAGATADCAATGNCFAFSVSVPDTRPALHWDSTFRETLSSGDVKNWTLHLGDSFTDVPRASTYYRFIETLLHRQIAGGCTGATYCPGQPTLREQMAVFVLVAKEGAGYTPPACTTPMFGDVPANSPYCRFIEELARRGVASGCGGGNYCPSQATTREQMAVFVLRTLDPAIDPPACTTPMFNDVPATSPFCKYIEELARRGVVNGCGGGAYCPGHPVTREQMGVFVTVTFGLTLYGPQ